MAVLTDHTDRYILRAELSNTGLIRRPSQREQSYTQITPRSSYNPDMHIDAFVPPRG